MKEMNPKYKNGDVVSYGDPLGREGVVCYAKILATKFEKGKVSYKMSDQNSKRDQYPVEAWTAEDAVMAKLVAQADRLISPPMSL